MPDRTHYMRDPRLNKCYAEGVHANRSGAAITTNPHDTLLTPEEDAWDQGWNDANAPAGAQTDYDMGLAGYPVATKAAPEADAIT